MKYRTTKKEVMKGYHKVICVPYCRLQNLLNCETPVAYTTRKEGWGADVYDLGGGVAIVTGYAPFGNVKPSYEVQQKYDEAAGKIRSYNNFDYAKCKRRLREAIWEFVEEVCNG